MFNNNKILVIIPARGSSKGIPRKNIRLLGEKPIISYTVETCKLSKYVDDVIVVSDDSEIIRLAEMSGAHAIKSSMKLSKDDISLEETLYLAMLQKENLTLDEYDIVCSILPTSPLLKVQSLDKMIERFEDNSIETVISVKGDRQLYWVFDDESKSYKSLYPQRNNLEFLPKTFKETGNFIGSRRHVMTPESNIGLNVDLFELSAEESLHIDTYEDWGIATNYLNKKKIAIVVNCNETTGNDNIFRCLSLASKIFFHDVLFLLGGNVNYLDNLMKKFQFPHEFFHNEEDLIHKLNVFSPDMVFNDFGDTSKEYIFYLKQKGYFVVNFGDLGSGYKLADLVFDDLYENNHKDFNIRQGSDFFILKDEFLFNINKNINPEVDNVLIFFESNDSNNLTEWVLKILINNFSKHIHVVLGSYYPNKQDFIDKYQIYQNVIIYNNIDNVNDLMFKSDIAFLSAGRSIYEACSIGIPSIVICQSERELTHSFANKINGFANLGLANSTSDEDILKVFNILINNFNVRQEMFNKMQSIDLEFGFDNLWYEIKKSYKKFNSYKKRKL